MINLSNKSFVIFGEKGGGKSWLTKHIMDSTPSHLIYDPLNEHPGYRQYVPDDRESVDELEDVINGMVIPWKPALFIIDEANRYVQPRPSRLPRGISSLNDFNRHWGIATGFVARRPVQFHSDLVELAHARFFFHLTGKGDHRYLEDLKVGLGDTVRQLPLYHFAIFMDGEIQIHTPIDKPKFPNET